MKYYCSCVVQQKAEYIINRKYYNISINSELVKRRANKHGNDYSWKPEHNRSLQQA